MKIVRIIGLLLAFVAAFTVMGVAASLWVYRDIPASKLEEKYAQAPSKFVEAGGVRYHVRQEGNGPDIVLLHGTFGNLFMWDGWVEALSDRYRITRFDLLAHGLTGPGPQDSYTTDELTESFHALVKELEIDEFHLVGTSSGGITAFTYAGEYPERIQSLALINSAGLLHKTVNPNASQVLPFRSRLLSRITPKSTVSNFILSLIGDAEKATPKVLDTYYDLIMRDGNRRAILRGFANYKPRDPNPWLNKIVDPTLIIWSDGSVLPTEEAQEFADNLGTDQVSIKIVKGGGHALPISHPEQTAEMADDFWMALQPERSVK